MNNGAYALNLDEYKQKGTNWIAQHVDGNNMRYFDSFAVEHIPK